MMKLYLMSQQSTSTEHFNKIPAKAKKTMPTVWKKFYFCISQKKAIGIKITNKNVTLF